MCFSIAEMGRSVKPCIEKSLAYSSIMYCDLVTAHVAMTRQVCLQLMKIFVQKEIDKINKRETGEMLRIIPESRILRLTLFLWKVSTEFSRF